MSLKYPDELQHNNPDLALVDSDFIRGGGRTVANLSAMYALTTKADQLKQYVTKVRVQSTSTEYLLIDINNIGNSGGWVLTLDFTQGYTTYDTRYAKLSGATFTGSVLLAGNPTAANEAVNKAYVDLIAQGFKLKDAVAAATTANITLSGEQTIDDVDVITGDRVLVKNQTDAKQNGIYIVDGGSWTRSTDADLGSELIGATVGVINGNQNVNILWYCNTPSPITIGVTNINFTYLINAINYTAGAGLTLSSGAFSISNNGVTYAKIQQVATHKILGNSTGGTANVQELTLGYGLHFNGTAIESTLTNLNQFTNGPGYLTSVPNPLLDNHGSPSINHYTRNLFDYPGINVVLDYQNRYLYNNANFISIDFGNSILNDVNEALSVDYTDRKLYYNNGEVSIDWQNVSLKNNLGNITLDWANGSLINPATGGHITVNWIDSNLISETSNNISVDWKLRKLFDSSDFLSVNWENKILYHNDGTTPAIEWSSSDSFLKFYGSDGNNFLSTEDYTLKGEDGLSTIYFGMTRQLVDSLGTPGADWENRTLNTNSGSGILNWSNDKFHIGDNTPTYRFSVDNKLYFDNDNNVFGLFIDIDDLVSITASNLSNSSGDTVAKASNGVSNGTGASLKFVGYNPFHATSGNVIAANRGVIQNSYIDGLHIWNDIDTKTIKFWQTNSTTQINTIEIGEKFVDNKVAVVESGLFTQNANNYQIPDNCSVLEMRSVNTYNKAILPVSPKTGMKIKVLFGEIFGTFTITSASNNINSGASATNSVTFPQITIFGSHNSTSFYYNGARWYILYS